MNNAFLKAIQNRRSIYTLRKESPISEERIEALLKEALTNVPSAFNSQSARIVLLFGSEHDALWEIVKEALRPKVPADRFSQTEAKINSFKSSYGTILYFDDTSVTNALKAQFPTYAENFEPWAEQANGMLQFAIWTLLESEGLGVNLQHYNPLIDAAVAKRFNLPDSWLLRAQMPFGAFDAVPPEKEKISTDERMRIFR